MQVGEERESEIHDNDGNQKALQTAENIGYTILVESRTGSDLNDVTVDYCIYYQQERPRSQGKVTEQGVKCGTLNIGTIAARAKVQLETQTIALFKREQQNGYLDNNVFEGEVLGIWIRVFLPLANGNKAMRECSKPNTLMKDRSWATSDILASINK
jgi:hypothetical protein